MGAQLVGGVAAVEAREGGAARTQAAEVPAHARVVALVAMAYRVVAAQGAQRHPVAVVDGANVLLGKRRPLAVVRGA